MAQADRVPHKVPGRLIGFSLCLLLTIDLAVGFDLWSDRVLALDAARTALQATCRTSAERIGRIVGGLDQVLSGLGEVLRERMIHAPEGQLKPGDPELVSLLQRRTAYTPFARAFTLLNARGLVIADSRSNASLLIDLSDRPYFIVHFERPSQSLYVGEPTISRIDDRWFLGASTTLFALDGGFAGAINAVVDPDSLYGQEGPAGEGPADQTPRQALINEAGVILALHPGQDQQLGTTLPEAALFIPRMRAAQTGLFQEQARSGQASLFAFRRIPGYPLVATAALPLAAALEPWHRKLLWHTAATLLVNGVLLLLIRRIARRRRRDHHKILELLGREAAALAGRQQLVDAIESLTDGFLLFDPQDRIVLFNSRYQRMLGPLGRQLRAGMSYEDLLRAVAQSGMIVGSADHPEAWIRSRLECHRNPAGPVEQQFSSGRWLMAWIYPTREGGRVHVRTDITFLKQQQLELTRQGVLLRTTVENIVQGLCVFDRESRLVLWNRNWLNLLRLPERFGQVGIRLEDVLQWRAQRGDYGPGDVDQIVAGRLADMNGLDDHLDERLLPDGRIVEVRGVPMPGGGRLTTYTDITQRKEAEQALRQKTEVLETTLESMDQGISLFDRNLLLIAANRRYSELMDYPPALAQLGTPYERFLRYSAERSELGDGAPDILVQTHLAAARSPLPTRLEHQRHDGTVIEVRGRPIPGGGFVRTYTDITERKHYENELKSAKALAERTSEIKSLFLAKMSHELRTPFNAIIGFADIIAKKSFGDDREAVESYASYASEIRHSGQHLLDLVNNILDISKIESGRMAVMIDRFDLRQVLNSSLGMMRELARGQEVTLNLEGVDTMPEVRADERAVKQIVTNLLSNALKFTPQGGQITVSVESLEDGGFDITVADTGVGIPDDQVDRILLPFEQGDNRYSRSAGGTGLGLALVKGLVELHGGELRIQSSVGIGTRITAHFPAYSGDLGGPRPIS
jgi:signal transduction histidine kinase